MPADVNFEEILIAPLEAIVKKVALSVGEAQRGLDAASLETQQKLQEKTIYPGLAEVGYISTWYHMPEIDLEIKMVMHYEETKGATEKGKYRVLWAPFNAKYKSTLAFEAGGTSSLKVKIVSTPPPIGLTAAKPIE